MIGMKKYRIQMALFIISFFVPIVGFAQQVTNQLQLSLNENAFGSSKLVKEAILEALDSINRYPSSGEALIRDIAQHEGVSPDQIIPGEILTLLGVHLGLKGGPGSEFIYSVPGYPALVNGASTVGGKVVPVPLNEHLENDLAAIEASITEKTQAIFLVNPHNPSGTVSNDLIFHDFLHRVSKRALVIVDEAYLEFTDNFQERTAVNNLKQGDRVIVFRTFAKIYGLAGLSLGYAVAPKELADDVRKRGLGDPHELNSLSVAAARAALKDKKFVKQVQLQVAEERDKWYKLLDSLHLPYSHSQGNFVFFNIGHSHEEVTAYLKAHGISIGRAFEPYHTWVRISIGLPKENEKARQAIAKLIENKVP